MGVAAGLGVAASGVAPAGDVSNAVLSGAFSAVGPSQPFPFIGWFGVSLWASFGATLTTTAGTTAATVSAAGNIAAGSAVKSANVPPGTTVASIAGTNVTLALPTITLQGVVTGNGKIGGLKSTAGLLGAAATGPGIPSGSTVTGIITPAVQPPSFPGGAATPGVVQLSNTGTTIQNSNQPGPINFALTANAITVTGADANATFTGATITWTGAAQLEKSYDGGNTYIVVSEGPTGAMTQWGGGTPVSALFSECERNVLYRVNCTAFSGANSLNYRISTSGAAGQTLSYGGNI